MRHDLLNDALLSLRHADREGRARVRLRPTSKLVGEVLGIFRQHQYVKDFAFLSEAPGGEYDVTLSRRINSCGVIKPRLSVRSRDLERYESRYLPAQDFGIILLSTNQGVMSHQKARELQIGGKLLAYVY